MFKKQLQYLTIIFVLVNCTNKREISNTDKTIPDTVIDNNIGSLTTSSKIDNKSIVKTYNLKELQGAWFDDSNENGLFYIDDSIFYLEARQSYYIWISYDSLFIDLNFDTVGFKILTVNDSIILNPFNVNDKRFLFRLEE